MEFKAPDFTPFPRDAARIATNLATVYDTWLDAKRARNLLPSSMFWVKRGDTDYLSVKQTWRDSGSTRGARSTETEAQLAKFLDDATTLDRRIEVSSSEITPLVRQYRSQRLPMVATRPGKILRELDLAGLLGVPLMLVGTNAFAAYQLQWGRRFPGGVDETEDIDFTWCDLRGASFAAATPPPVVHGSPLLRALRAFDPSFAVNKRKPYQAVNDEGYEVELLVAPSQLKNLSSDEVFSPVAGLFEQEWLLKGEPLRHVAITQDNKPCSLYVPDPRWMALHKLWLADQPKRNALKRDKDRTQGHVLLDAARLFPDVSYPIDLNFALELPQELRDIFLAWCESRGYQPS